MQKLLYPPPWSWGALIFFLINALLIFAGCEDDVLPGKTPKPPRVKKAIQYCEKGENSCSVVSKCKKICDLIFSKKESEKKCYKLLPSSVTALEELKNQMKDADDIKDIETKAVGCFLEIDAKEFSKLIDKTSRSGAKNFLEIVAENKLLAEAIENKDNDFYVLKSAFKKAVGDKTLYRVLTRDIEDSKTFLQLADEENSNSYAFYWLDSFVQEECSDGNAFCPKDIAISAYCKALTRLSERELDSFLSDADHFEEEYKSEVKSAGFDYDEEGFLSFCCDEFSVCSSGGGSSGGSSSGGSSSGSGSSSGGSSSGGSPSRPESPPVLEATPTYPGSTPASICPTDNTLPASQKLADITFKSITLPRGRRLIATEYYKVGFKTSATASAKTSNSGSSSPDQNKILGIISNRSHTKIYLNGNAISNFDKTKSWWFAANGYRFPLDYQHEYTVGSLNYQVFQRQVINWPNTIFRDTKTIHLGWEESGNCHYVTP